MVNFKVLLQRIQNISIFLLTKGAHIIAFLTTKKNLYSLEFDI